MNERLAKKFRVDPQMDTSPRNNPANKTSTGYLSLAQDILHQASHLQGGELGGEDSWGDLQWGEDFKEDFFLPTMKALDGNNVHVVLEDKAVNASIIVKATLSTPFPPEALAHSPQQAQNSITPNM